VIGVKQINLTTMFFLVVVTLVSSLFQATISRATTITIVNLDGANEGFNDPAPFTPVGGNTATTLGQARLNAFQYAADLWAACISSNVTILVEANMDPLSCTPFQAILGGAGTNTVHANFPNAPFLSVLYPQALANSLAGVDLSANRDMGATFSSSLNGSGGCLGGAEWYYGFDENPPPGDLDFVSVVVHEIGHGLGFQTFVNLTTGAKFAALNDTYMLNLEDHGENPALYPAMTDQQRVNASKADPDLHWVGPAVSAEGPSKWVAGISNGHVRMHGPSQQQPGSSVSHWTTAASPNELMEPGYTSPNHDPGLAVALMQDIGWVLIPKPTGIPEGRHALAYALGQNYPNPFNPTTEITYEIPWDETVSLSVYDVSGKLVRTLVNGDQGAGPHRAVWNGKDNAGQQVSSGVYFYRLGAGSFVETRRMVLLK
jgi:hypothetical protein